MKRQIRRNHYYRLKQKRGKRAWQYQYDHIWDDSRAALLANTSRPCSCWMCGNVRRHWGQITKKEQEAKLTYIEGCEEAGVRSKFNRSHVRFSNYW